LTRVGYLAPGTVLNVSVAASPNTFTFGGDGARGEAKFTWQ
jgi:3-oxoacyl-ACP reductase-like protein